MRLVSACKPLIVFSIVSNILMLVAPIHMMQVYDRVLSSGSGETLLYITLIGAFCLVLFGFSEMLRTQIAQRISAKYAVSKTDPLFNGMTKGSVAVEKSNEIMRDFNTVRSFLASRSMIGLFDLPFSPFFLMLLFLLHFQLGVLTTIGVAALIAIAYVNKSSTAKDQEEASKASTKALGFSRAIASRSEDIRSMGLLPALVERWGGMMGESLNAHDVSASKGAFFFGLSKSVRQILQISIMAWGAWLVLNGDMSGGMIFAASMISGRVLQPIEQVIGGWAGINRAQDAHKNVEKVLSGVESSVEKIRQPNPKGYLTVRDISFAVEGADGQEIEILDKVSFSLKPRELTAVIGPSGAGKSTLARILSGATTPTEGEVALDGCLQKNWSVEQWGQCVGYVGQEVLLFPGSVAENIARMAVEPDEAQVIEASRLAGAHDLINSFPQGYMTNIGDAGIRLSGGQKQRIALARALYSKPKLLILDEPNAHLDQQGEAILMQSLQRAKQEGVTILVVAQRQQVLKIADHVMMIKNGRKVDLQHEMAKAKAKTTDVKKAEPQIAKPELATSKISEPRAAEPKLPERKIVESRIREIKTPEPKRQVLKTLDQRKPEPLRPDPIKPAPVERSREQRLQSSQGSSTRNAVTSLRKKLLSGEKVDFDRDLNSARRIKRGVS